MHITIVCAIIVLCCFVIIIVFSSTFTALPKQQKNCQNKELMENNTKKMHCD